MYMQYSITFFHLFGLSWILLFTMSSEKEKFAAIFEELKEAFVSILPGQYEMPASAVEWIDRVRFLKPMS
jgi:hypothetical protein